MNTHADKTQENKNRSVANAVSKKQTSGESTFQFVGNRPEAIAQRKLQKMANNSSQAKQVAQLQTMADNYSVRQQQPIQLKKSTRPSDTDLIGLISNGVEGSVIDGKTTDSEKGDAIWTKLNNEYDGCKTKGDGYWASLQVKIADYKDVGKKTGLVSDLDSKRASNSSKFADNYSNTIENLSATKYRVNTEGYDPDAGAKPVVSTGKYKGDYSNEFDIGSGEIKAAWNFAEDDKARAAGKGINNSEILYRQYREAAEEYYKTDGDKDAKVNSAIKGISKITRDNVINDTTLAVLYIAYPNGVKPSDEDKTWNTTSDEFKAILGTPNAKSTPFLLMDHLDEMEKTIDNIETKSGSNLDINLKDI